MRLRRASAFSSFGRTRRYGTSVDAASPGAWQSRSTPRRVGPLGSWPDADPGTAFIGIGYALRSDSSTDSRFAICCSQVFDAEGSGLEFVAYEASDVRLFGKNPFLRRDQMMKVMSRSLSIYQRKHSGDPPRRIVVHKSTEFRQEEVDGVFDAFSGGRGH